MPRGNMAKPRFNERPIHYLPLTGTMSGLTVHDWRMQRALKEFLKRPMPPREQ